MERIAAASLDKKARKIIAIMNDAELSTDEKMRKMCEIDQRYYAKKSPFWADALRVTEQAIRKTDFWKIDLKRAKNHD